MTLPVNLSQRELNKFRDSSGVAVAVVNPDGTTLLANATVAIGSAATIYAVVNTGAGNSNVTLNPSPNFIGLATVVPGTAFPVTDNGSSLTVDWTSGATVAVSNLPAIPVGSNFIGLVSTASIQGNVGLVAGTNFVGLATVVLGRTPILGAGDTTALFASTATGTMLNTSLMGRTGNVATVDSSGNLAVIAATGTNFIGLATVVQGNQPALIASSAYIGLASVNIGGTLPALTAGSAYIGLATVVLGRGPILGAGDTTALFASTATGSMLNTSLMGRTGNVATVDSSGNLSVINATGTNFIGLATVVQGNQPALVAGTAYVGLASVNVGGTLPALSTGTNFIGLATVVMGSTATVFQVPISTYTSLATVISASGNATLFLPPSNQRWVVKDLIIGVQGSVLVSILSGTGTVIPAMSLATQSGYISNFGDSGLRGKATNDSFVVNLGSAATIAVMANVRFE